ncbi:Os01g0660450 [Oryza sativa Japonica Group]|uniref:Os01g0660450 protein n=1 Tax=Oryza sativa subsp. japonica TaxID=39947 RepID=A0A0P0V667_ORYSJ|nr:Os01g0660450 [Oryza sativa Japonica Group]
MYLQRSGQYRFTREQPPANLIGHVCVDAGVVDLLPRQRRLTPSALRNVFLLLHVGAHHRERQSLQPRPRKLRLTEHGRRSISQIHRTGDPQVAIIGQTLHVVVDCNADEANARVGEELRELMWDHVAGLVDLEQEASAADTELEHRDLVTCFAVGQMVSAPLRVDADDEPPLGTFAGYLVDKLGSEGVRRRDGGVDRYGVAIHEDVERVLGWRRRMSLGSVISACHWCRGQFWT